MTDAEAISDLHALAKSELSGAWQHALALTAMGEARGDARDGSSVEERIAVMCVIRNRLALRAGFGRSWGDVVFQANQFSCWRDDDPNRVLLLDLWRITRERPPTVPPSAIDRALFKETRFLAAGIGAGDLLDRTGGALNYYAPASMKPAGRVPEWAAGKPFIEIGRQRFLKA